MGSASRQGFDLFHPYGRKAFFRSGILGDKWGRRYVLQDTFGKFICKIKGHKLFNSADDIKNYVEASCSRCGKLIASCSPKTIKCEDCGDIMDLISLSPRVYICRKCKTMKSN
jgi:hypothetical protein